MRAELLVVLGVAGASSLIGVALNFPVLTISGLAAGLWANAAIARRASAVANASDQFLQVAMAGLLFAWATNWPTVGVAFVSAHALAAYFINGLVKAADAEWRSGRAIVNTVRSEFSGTPAHVTELFRHRGIGLVSTWVVISLELLSPLSLLYSPWSIVIVAGLATFHLVNAALLGLTGFPLTFGAGLVCIMSTRSAAASFLHT